MSPARACAYSDLGLTRKVNEDYFAVEPEEKLYLVADGMGGHGHGEIASRLAIEAIRDAMREPSGGRSMASGDRLRRAFVRANREVLDAVAADESLVGMGTTLVALHLEGERITVAHVGDSRAYRLRDGQLKQLTDDHTWVAEQVTAGNISESQALRHPFKSVVTRALGGDEQIEVELSEWRSAPGDLYLLCSDGLTTMIADDVVRTCLAAGGSLDATCRDLIRAANERGGRDNITVLVLAID